MIPASARLRGGRTSGGLIRKGWTGRKKPRSSSSRTARAPSDDLRSPPDSPRSSGRFPRKARPGTCRAERPTSALRGRTGPSAGPGRAARRDVREVLVFAVENNRPWPSVRRRRWARPGKMRRTTAPRAGLGTWPSSIRRPGTLASARSERSCSTRSSACTWLSAGATTSAGGSARRLLAARRGHPPRPDLHPGHPAADRRLLGRFRYPGGPDEVIMANGRYDLLTHRNSVLMIVSGRDR
jgi:hypothetical protein